MVSLNSGVCAWQELPAKEDEGWSIAFDIACLTEQRNNKRRLQRNIRRGVCGSILDWYWYVERSCRCFWTVLVTVILENTAIDELGACAHQLTPSCHLEAAYLLRDQLIKTSKYHLHTTGVGLEAIFSQKYGRSIRLVCSNKWKYTKSQKDLPPSHLLGFIVH